MQNVTHEMTAHWMPIVAPRRLATDRRQSLCFRWRMVFGSRLVIWRRSPCNQTGMPYSVVFSQCPAS